jgi:hypothetical protein
MSGFCPTCNDPLSASGVCGSCGYGRKFVPSRPIDGNRNRCAWVSDGDRCCYIGTISYSSPTPAHYPELFCIGHYGCEDMQVGARVISESKAAMPADFDYSSEAIVRRIRERNRCDPHLDLERAAIQSEAA